MSKIEPCYPRPFVKWVGGKRQLLSEINARLPKSFGDYYEPFVGGGALFFDLCPPRGFINDRCIPLINSYCQIRDNVHEVMSCLDTLDNEHSNSTDSKAYYYDMRDRYNMLISSNCYDVNTATLFIYLNKHCFNGLYRVNSQGKFNVPYNNSMCLSYDAENIKAVAKVLRDVVITNKDFDDACLGAKACDFVFIDSPYAPLKADTFESYTKEGFSKDEHIRLSHLYKKLTDKGCYCMLTNHNTSFIHELYDGYKIDVVAVRRAINSNASKRTGAEVIITNY